MSGYQGMKNFFVSKIFVQDSFSLTKRTINRFKLFYAHLFMKRYKKIVSTSVEVDKKNKELCIFLPDDILTQIKKVEFYDFQGFLGRHFSFRDYKISGNYLVINFRKMPVAGQMAILVSTAQGTFVIKYCNEKLEFGQWKILSGFGNKLIVTPKSNGLVRPKRQQVLIKQFSIDNDLVMDIPSINIDDIAILNKNVGTFTKINYEIKKGSLFIDINKLPLIGGQLYEILIISGKNHYRIFQPSGVFLDEHRRYQRINNSMKYVYISDEGYLYFYCLNQEQMNRLSSAQKWEAEDISVSGDEVRLSFNVIPLLLNDDTVVVKRYQNIIPFNYMINKNVLILKPRQSDIKMLGDFPYTLAVRHDNKGTIDYTPVRLRQSRTENINSNVTIDKIYLTNSPIEVVKWGALPVVGIVRENLVFVKSNSLDATIKKVLAEYKERPVYTNITNGISEKKLRNAYKKIRVVYKKQGELLINDVSVSSIVDYLVR